LDWVAKSVVSKMSEVVMADIVAELAKVQNGSTRSEFLRIQLPIELAFERHYAMAADSQ
jgi:hypothetical protein